MRLSELKNKTRDIEIKLSDADIIKLVVKQDWYTPRIEQTFQDFDKLPITNTASMLADCIISWDVTDENLEVIKPTKEVLYDLGIKALTAIMTGIREALLPN